MLTAEQLKQRTGYLGASDCAAVLGLSRWKSPLKLWTEKTGLVPPEDKSNELQIEVGNELEDAVCNLFAKRTGKKVERVKDTIFHPVYPFLAVNLDRRVVGEDADLEAKTASGWKIHEWDGDEIPQEYILQVLHSMACTGRKRNYVACLIGGNQAFRYVTVERDEKLIADIVAKEVHFWKTFVEPKVMPALITKDDGDTLNKLFPHGEDNETIDLGDEGARLVESIKAMQADYTGLDGMIEKQKNELKAMLKENSVGKAGAWKVTWKEQEDNRVDPKKLRDLYPDIAKEVTTTKTIRVLRTTKPK